MSATYTDQELRGRFPAIEWDKPIMVNGRFYACRLCIARKGLKGVEVHNLPKTQEEWEQHHREAHGD